MSPDDKMQQFSDAMQSLTATTWELEELASAFAITGNRPVAIALRVHAARIGEAVAIARAAYSHELDRGFRQAQAASSNILRTALALTAKE